MAEQNLKNFVDEMRSKYGLTVSKKEEYLQEKAINKSYTDILLLYLGEVTVAELKEFDVKLYNLIKSDFEPYFSQNKNKDESSILVSKLVDWSLTDSL